MYPNHGTIVHLKGYMRQVANMPTNSARIANPFVYGRVLGSQDAACPRSTYEHAIEEAVTNRGRLALVGDRRLGKSTLVERTHEVLGAPLLHWDFHKVYSGQDLVHRAAEDLERFVRELSPIARKVTPWLREVGLGIQDIKLSYHGVGAALSTRMPTDHLKRLLGYVAEIANCFTPRFHNAPKADRSYAKIEWPRSREGKTALR